MWSPSPTLPAAPLMDTTGLATQPRSVRPRAAQPPGPAPPPLGCAACSPSAAGHPAAVTTHTPSSAPTPPALTLTPAPTHSASQTPMSAS